MRGALRGSSLRVGEKRTKQSLPLFIWARTTMYSARTCQKIGCPRTPLVADHHISSVVNLMLSFINHPQQKPSKLGGLWYWVHHIIFHFCTIDIHRLYIVTYLEYIYIYTVLIHRIISGPSHISPTYFRCLRLYWTDPRIRTLGSTSLSQSVRSLSNTASWTSGQALMALNTSTTVKGNISNCLPSSL